MDQLILLPQLTILPQEIQFYLYVPDIMGQQGKFI